MLIWHQASVSNCTMIGLIKHHVKSIPDKELVVERLFLVINEPITGMRFYIIK